MTEKARQEDHSIGDGQLELDLGMGRLERPAEPKPPSTKEATPPYVPQPTPAPTPAMPVGNILFQLNGSPLRLPRKENGGSYYLMDLLQYSGINLNNPKGTIELTVNGEPGMFQQKLREGDSITIEEKRL